MPVPDVVHRVARRWKGKPRSMELISVEPVDVRNELGEVVGEKMSFQLNERNLKGVISQVPRGMPVAFVSVVGAFRSGKSFLLSCFLEVLDTDDSDDPFEQGVLGGKSSSADGFSWKGGTTGHTQGMMVWSKPFIQEVDDGEAGRTEMAVLLVDTQGTFDHTTGTHLEACLFGLGTTLSSCQIFNVRNLVQADDLGGLAVYLEYGVRAQEIQTGGGQEDGSPFQRLEVLIRDWHTFADNTDPATVAGDRLRGEFLDYLDEILARPTTNTAKIKECFRDRIGCFGLPFPGRDVARPSFDGDIGKIDEDFRRLVKYYVKDVIFGKLKKTNTPSFLNTGPNEFVSVVKPTVQLFSDCLTNGKLPDADSWLGTMHAVENHNRMEEVLGIFKKKMEKHMSTVIYPHALPALLENHKDIAMISFKPVGDDVARQKANKALRNQLENEAARMNARNASRMTWYQSTIFVVKLLTALHVMLYVGLVTACQLIQEGGAKQWRVVCTRLRTWTQTQTQRVKAIKGVIQATYRKMQGFRSDLIYWLRVLVILYVLVQVAPVLFRK